MTPSETAYQEFIRKWLRYKDFVNLCDVLKNNSISNIAIYGGGNLGRLLYEYFYETEINVSCIIDRNANLKFPYNIDVYLPEDFKNSGITVDAIIIAVLAESYRIDAFLKANFDCEIIKLDGELICDVDVLISFISAVDYIEKCNARLYIVEHGTVWNIKNPSAGELNHILHGTKHDNYFNHDEYGIKLLQHYYDDIPDCDEQYLNSLCVRALRVDVKEGYTKYIDYESRTFNVINGIRCTTDNPETYDNTIHFYGDCWSSGFYAEDKLTVESQLQRLLNAKPLHNKRYRVLNQSNVVRGIKQLMQSCCRILHTDFMPGDIIVLLFRQSFSFFRYYLNSKSACCFDAAHVFQRPHNMGEIFLDGSHTNHRGYKLLADEVYRILSEPFSSSADTKQTDFFIKNIPPMLCNSDFESIKIEKPETGSSSLSEYISYLRSEMTDCDGVIGAIVMNCNPFTLGHKYLTEQAAMQCDFLYIFVVEEDKSFFSFEDRFMLVKAGTSGIKNVKVVRGGAFIISASTFPDYFNKEKNPNPQIDASKDVSIFAHDIAPVLHITKRFIGEEPYDFVTRQYNSMLLEHLPDNGISVHVIPRKSAGDEVISASRVRELLKTRDFAKIAEFVPESTFIFLTEKYL